MTTQDLYITACEQLDIPVSVAKSRKLSLDDLYTLLSRDYNQEMSLFIPDIE